MITSWKTLGEARIPNIEEFVRTASSTGQVVHIGTDSMQTGKYTQFVTVIAILTPGKGGRAAYKREIVPRIKSLRERLLREVWLSVELGLTLSSVIPGELTVHVDANPEARHKSSQYIQELVGMVVSNGFAVKIKPESWAASHAADHIVRIHGKLPRAI